MKSEMSLERDFAKLGQSGAQISIQHSPDGDPLIRKHQPIIGRDKPDDTHKSRLLIQASLQELARASGDFSEFYVPEVRGVNAAENWIEMDFAEGITLGDALELLQPDDLDYVGNSIQKYLFGRSPKDFEVGIGDSNGLWDQAEELVEQKIHRFWSENPKMSQFLASTPDRVNFLLASALENPGRKYSASCHGDFSLENILWDGWRKRLALIDFLDGPLPTRLADAGRLYLDLRYGWWRNSNESSIASASRWALFKQVFGPAPEEYKATDVKASHLAIRASALLAAFRVLPYTKIPRRKALLFYSSKELLRELEEMT